MFVLGSEDKSAVEIDLRAVQQGAQITQIKTFDITIDNVVQAKQGGSITADSNDPTLKIVKAKVITDTAIENLRELQRAQGNTFSLAALVSGVYILDIIAQKDNRDLAYETILVILAPGETTTTTTTTAVNLQIINNIISKVKNSVRTEVVFRDGNGGGSGGNGGSGDGGGGGSSGGNGCSNTPGSAGMGFPYQKATQCQKLEFDQCERTGENSARCDTAEERFSDDCEGFSNQQECDAHFSVPLNPIIPIAPLPDCSDVPAGTTCSKEEGTIVEDLPLCSDAAPGSECRDEAGNLLRQPLSSEMLPESETPEPESECPGRGDTDEACLTGSTGAILGEPEASVTTSEPEIDTDTDTEILSDDIPGDEPLSNLDLGDQDNEPETETETPQEDQAEDNDDVDDNGSEDNDNGNGDSNGGSDSEGSDSDGNGGDSEGSSN